MDRPINPIRGIGPFDQMCELIKLHCKRDKEGSWFTDTEQYMGWVAFSQGELKSTKRTLKVLRELGFLSMDTVGKLVIQNYGEGVLTVVDLYTKKPLYDIHWDSEGAK